jgi:uncharacterized protein YbbK (DUF523 family)
MEKILISSCLVGCNVRYHGGNAEVYNDILESFKKNKRLIPICPEVSAGLPIPRTSSEIVGGIGSDVHKGTAKVISRIGENKTSQFIIGANNTLDLAIRHKIKVAILKKNSPSCGNSSIYDGSFSNKIIKGSGVTASLLTENGIKVFNETELLEAKKYIEKIEKNDS